MVAELLVLAALIVAVLLVLVYLADRAGAAACEMGYWDCVERREARTDNEEQP